jgi:hypothetical protein
MRELGVEADEAAVKQLFKELVFANHELRPTSWL